MASISSLKRIVVPEDVIEQFDSQSRDINAMTDVAGTIDCTLLRSGRRVRRFEDAFAEYSGASHVVGVNSCAAAVHLSLMACGIGTGNEVITTPLTFSATANAIIHAGATPVFADVDSVSWNLDPLKAAARVSSRTRGLLVVHYAGRPAAMAGFRTLASHYGLLLIDDAAQCIEGVSAGRKIGIVGDFTCFSVSPFGDLPAAEGGIVTTSNAEAAAFMRTASMHGMASDPWPCAPGVSPQHDLIMPGFKYAMTDLHAAVGLQRLAQVDAMASRRSAIWMQYDKALASLPLHLPAPVADGDVHARNMYVVVVDERSAGLSRDVLHARLVAAGIAASVPFRALHLHPYYQARFGLRRGMFPVAEAVSDASLSLPLSPGMSPTSVERIIEVLHAILR